MRFQRIIFCVIAFLAVVPVCRSQTLFRSVLLEEMADAMGAGQFASLGEGEHYAVLQYRGFPVTVIVRKGVVQHIGYSFFSPSMRDEIGPVVSSFLERYALEAELPLQRKKDVHVQQMEDGVFFNKGNLSSLKVFCADTTQTISFELIASRRYRVTWSSGDMLFPADHHLLLGSDNDENESRLPDEIKACGRPSHPAQVTGDTFYIEQLSSRLYYDTAGRAVDDVSKPSETLANMLGGAVSSGDLTADVEMRCYGFTRRYFEAPLSSLVSYGIESGCVPYFGLVRNDEDILECELVLRQYEAGYAHVLKLWVSKKSLKTKKGSVKVRITPFIPMHSLRYLFEETSQ